MGRLSSLKNPIEERSKHPGWQDGGATATVYSGWVQHLSDDEAGV